MKGWNRVLAGLVLLTACATDPIPQHVPTISNAPVRSLDREKIYKEVRGWFPCPAWPQGAFDYRVVDADEKAVLVYASCLTDHARSSTLLTLYGDYFISK